MSTSGNDDEDGDSAASIADMDEALSALEQARILVKSAAGKVSQQYLAWLRQQDSFVHANGQSILGHALKNLSFQTQSMCMFVCVHMGCSYGHVCQHACMHVGYLI